MFKNNIGSMAEQTSDVVCLAKNVMRLNRDVMCLLAARFDIEVVSTNTKHQISEAVVGILSKPRGQQGCGGVRPRTQHGGGGGGVGAASG